MDNHDQDERERSEPCSARTNPFMEDEDTVSRKRQKTVEGGSRSLSIDTTKDVEVSSERTSKSPRNRDEPTSPYQTPNMSATTPSEPSSSKVTINLRNPQSPIPPSTPRSPSNLENGTVPTEARASIESESDAITTIPPVETPSSSPSQSSSPRVELITMIDDDRGYDTSKPPLAIIAGDDESDIMEPFPGARASESSAQAVLRMARHFQYDEIEDPDCFIQVCDWIDGYLDRAQDMISFYDAYINNREVWMKIPELMNALSRRSRFFGAFLQRSREGRKALSDMFAQFARLAARFLVMDTASLEQNANRADDYHPDLASPVYLRAYSLLIRKEENSHIGRNLETHYNWDWDVDVLTMSEFFKEEGGTILQLARLVRGQTNFLDRNPKLAEQFTEMSRITAKVICASVPGSIVRDAHHQQLLTAEQRSLLIEGYEYFKMMSTTLGVIIDKYVTNISSEAVMVHLNHLSTIYTRALIYDNPETLSILETFHNEHSNIPLGPCLTKSICYSWKLAVLEKLITSAQMQLRVIGITTMCTDLLHLYTIDKDKMDPFENPVLLHCADLLIKQRLVDYIVGVGSHPEIINESNNLIGFLVVTKTYTDQDTDRIWHTVMSSQDPRVVAATLRMLGRLIGLYEIPQMLHLCRKLDEVPPQVFGSGMRDLAQRLLDFFIGKWRDGSQTPQTAPYELCVRLVRASAISANDGSIAYPDLHAFALQAMQSLILYGPPSDTRSKIYQDCMDDISSGSGTAMGSICLINLLLRRNPADLVTLTTEHDLTRLLIEKVEEAHLQGNGVEEQQLASPHGIPSVCLEVLMLVISNHPDTVPNELGKRLWYSLVGSETISVNDRNNSWAALNNVMHNSIRMSQPNIFLLSCFQEYFPLLPAICFTGGSLEFVKAMIEFWIEQVRHQISEGEQKFDSLAVEQLWRMILTAPPNTIESSAIKVLVKVFVESDLILTIPRGKARSIHQDLVERCLNQLGSAAAAIKVHPVLKKNGSGNTNLMVSENDYMDQEKIFARSLAVLREFLKCYQTKPQFVVPKPPPQVLTASRDAKGEPFEVFYQSFDGNSQTEVRKLTLGTLSTAASLLANLQEATGFKNYKVYFGGKPFDPTEVDVCRSLEDLNLKGLVLVQRREDIEGSSNNPSSVPVSLEMEIMKHIDQLWEYLTMHDKVAQEIYYFLIKFPVYGRLQEMLRSDAVSHSEIFPDSQPFKSLYAIHVIKETLLMAPHREGPEQLSLTRAISLITAALNDEKVLNGCDDQELKACLAMNLVDCLIQLLKESSSSSPVVAPVQLLNRLLSLMLEAKFSVTSNSSAHLTIKFFEAILEASLHSSEIWKAFVLHLESSGGLKDLLLEEPRSLIRKSVVKQIVQQCAYTRNGAQVSAVEFTLAFWPHVSSLIPEAIFLPQQCEEVFTLSLALFREGAVQAEHLGELVTLWGDLLVNSENGLDQAGELQDSPEAIDTVALGLTNLLQAATQLAKASSQRLSCGAIGTQLFSERLFPDLTDEADLHLNPHPRLPLLHTTTRERLIETVFLLIKDDTRQYLRVLKALTALTPYSAGEEEPYCYELSWNFDRAHAIRSQIGYVGLRNLSNTCYLNSLFTQLYMNVPFRDFMLNLNISDADNQQKLLTETQTLFSYMQNSLSRFVDPANVACSIQTYDNAKIDVSVQMDVDEFYNLLFDRWESQIPSPALKRNFKSFYGGQLVQQVKSKECDHISEREESFSAIQCEIKGKTCLQESLQAYVEGEVMEGDNKYKCSSCDRHVDAVKRACLKEVPDHLIFHLKRFDFNLRSLQRSKINDHFAFPKSIDMRPYKVEFLMDDGNHIPEDIFELVGVLVHSGTAESGHYYSYVRERPSTDNKEPWIEFNDELVTTWDPSTVEACCFGGPDLRPGIDPGYDKSYSAYMLFYQRATTLIQQNQTLEDNSLKSPVRLDVPILQASVIAQENELALRKYCLNDPAHTVFVSKMLGNMKKVNGGRCSDSHQHEKTALWTALNHLDQVVARAKDLPQFSGFLGAITRVCNACAECSRDYLEWYIECTEALRLLLLRNPDVGVRSEISNSILAALKKIKADASYAYGLDDDDDQNSEMERPPQIIQKFVKAMVRLYDTFHLNTRAWPEYFGLLGDIANLGREEAAILLDNHFLQKMFSIVCADPLLQPDQQYLRMYHIVAKRVATRPVSYEAVVSLLARLLQTCDGSLEPIPDGLDRLPEALDNRPVPLTQSERQYMLLQWSRNESNILVDKLLRINQNEFATQAIITWLLKSSDKIEHSLERSVYNSIATGLQRSPPAPAAAPFINAALTFCELSEASGAIEGAIRDVAKAAYSSEALERKEFIQFFHAVTKLPVYSSGLTREEIIGLVMNSAPLWGPALLTSPESTVRESAELLLHEIILRHGVDLNSVADNDHEDNIEVIQAANRLGLSCLDYIEEVHLRRRTTAVAATMLSIQIVIEACSGFFSDDEDDLEAAEFHSRKEIILTALKKCLVDEIDEETSEWEASDEYPSSEPEFNDADAGI